MNHPVTGPRLPAFRALLERLPLNVLRSLGTLHTCGHEGRDPDHDQLTLVAGATTEVFCRTPLEKHSELESASLTINAESELEIRFRVYGSGSDDTIIGAVTKGEFLQLLEEVLEYEAPMGAASGGDRMREMRRYFTTYRKKRVADLRHLITAVLAERVKAVVIAKALQQTGNSGQRQILGGNVLLSDCPLDKR